MEIKIDDLVINYEKTGHNQAVIIMHGWGQNLEMMYSVVNGLKDDYLIYNIDLPGFGYSDEPNYSFSVSDYVDILKKFIALNNIDNPIIIGHSFGCRIAIKYASETNNVKAMVLTGAAGIKPKRNILYYFKVYTYKFFKLFKGFPFIKYYVQEMIDNSGSDDYKNSSPIMKGVLQKVVNEDLSEYLTKISVPTLLIFGSKDDATPLWMGHKMNNEISNSKLIVYEGLSHYAYLEDSERFKNDVSIFLKGVIDNG